MVHVKLKSKPSRVRKGTIRKKILLVVHTCPDWDAVVGAFLKLIIMGFTQLDNPKYVLCFAFVPPGKRVTKRTIDEINPNIVVHLDTGSIFDPKTNDFDHHPPSPDIKPEFDSTATLLQSVYPEELAQYPWLDDLIYATNCKDSGNPIETRDPTAQELRGTLNIDLRNSGFIGLRVVDELEQFRNWITIFSNLLCSDEEKMRTGLNWLFGWHELCRPKTERIALVAKAEVVRTAHGVNLGILPLTDIARKKVRNQLRIDREHGFDTCLCLVAESERTSIGILCLNDMSKPNMNALLKALVEKYNATLNSENKFEFIFQSRKVELFLHARKFVMYLHLENVDIAPALYREVRALAIEHL